MDKHTVNFILFFMPLDVGSNKHTDLYPKVCTNKNLVILLGSASSCIIGY